MDIQFPEQFQQELSDKFLISPMDVLDTIQSPDSFQKVQLDDLTLHFYLKEIPQTDEPFYLLAYGRQEDDTFMLDMSWKLQRDWYPDLNDLTLVELLGEFAGTFGLPVSINGETQQFYFDREFRVPVNNWQNTIHISNPENHDYVQQIFTKQYLTDETVVIRCALGLCIDIDRYRTGIQVL